MTMTQEDVFEKVRDVLKDALGVDDDEVVLGAKLTEDLGAESIDFLDIAFRLEKAFNIKIEQGEMLPENVLSDARYVVDGRVTNEGMAELGRRMPHANLDEFEASGRKVEDFPSVFTVDAVVKFVQTKLAAA
jgi:acyl carrier protein